jgi:hypothetical protein
MIEEYVNRVDAAIAKAMSNETKLEERHFALNGMSARENRIFLNEVLKTGDKYLEIGVHRGSTFVSALYNNDVKAVAIDNFSQFGQVREEFLHNCSLSGLDPKMTFVEADCFNLTDEQKELVKGTNVYFYDGDHRHEDQEMALTYYIDCLTDPFIFIVDDWNHNPAVTGTQAGIEKTGLKVQKEWILNNPNTGKNWHNALYVAVLSR